jgi:hypothetical protein
LYFGTREQIESLRRAATPTNQFRFGEQLIHTKVHMMVPKSRGREIVDVAAALFEAPVGQDMSLNILK